MSSSSDSQKIEKLFVLIDTKAKLLHQLQTEKRKLLGLKNLQEHPCLSDTTSSIIPTRLLFKQN